MPFVQLWGADNLLFITPPEHPIAYIILLLYSLVLACLFYVSRADLRKYTRLQWFSILGLCIASLITSQLFPIPLPTRQSIPLESTPYLTLLASVPMLFAGAVLGPVAALLVGLCSGLGRALGDSHQYFDLFHFAFTAVLAAFWLQQNYSGRMYDWLRRPLVAGPIALSSAVVLKGITDFLNAPDGLSSLAALDWALATADLTLYSLLLESLVGGLIITLIFHNLPELRPQKTLIPSPSQRSLRLRLLNQFTLFAGLLFVFMVVIVFNVAITVSTRLVVNQMVHNAQTVSMEVPDFQTNLQNVVTQFEDKESLLSEDKTRSQKALEQVFKQTLYRQMIVVNAEQGVEVYYPPDTPLSLTRAEQDAVNLTFSSDSPTITQVEANNQEHTISLVVPIQNNGLTTSVLVARVPQVSLRNLIIGLEGTAGQGEGFIVDEYNDVIADSGNGRLFSKWFLPDNPNRINTTENASGVAYQGYLPNGTRELVYYLPVSGTNHPWKVVTTVPYTVVLNLAWNIGWPMAIVITVISFVFYGNLALLGRDITQPIVELVEASKTLAAGGNWTPATTIQREDEVGQLNKAFAQMQRSMKQRLNELSLLLGVSHDISHSIDMTQGMPIILRGALRGTNAAGARAVVLSPTSGYPQPFGEGPSAELMSILDRQLMIKLRQNRELMLSSPEQIRQVLELPETAEIPVAALIAFSLQSHDRFQGVLWLGYRQAHTFDLIERNLLQTLAGQAAVLVENTRLFATAEGGRRRLAAVLASTTDAVIVTDQTERILLVNRAMEKLFRIHAQEVVGRHVADVIKVEPLVQALTGKNDHVRNLEIPTIEGHTYYTNISSISSNDKQIWGRVAVLHDVTHLKELDSMKSEFVSTVSHDLRSPLTFMRGYATMLPMAGELSDKQRDYVDKILAGIDQMAQLVNDLLDLGRIEASVDLRDDPIELRPLLSDIATDYWQHAHLNGIKLQVDVPPGLPVVRGDVALIRQAITNYITNGIKYAANSGPMSLKAEQQNGEVIISVQDSGPGISPQHLPRLFEKFYRPRERGMEKIKGSGLGLAIVKSIAERHGGRVWVQSQVGKGSTFYISLPVPEGSVNNT